MFLDESTPNYIIIIVAAYLLGSIPFGLILSRLTGHGDIRKHGSGNIGATNVWRVANKKLAILTLLLDALKGVVAVMIARAVTGSENMALVAGITAVIGHVFPIWLKLKGGKGVATTFAVLLTLQPALGVLACAFWVGIFWITRVSSLSAILTMTATPVIAFYFAYQTGYGLVYATLFLSVLVITKHHSNIERLIAGEEKQTRIK